jgi:para-nitrobenzyl esterase
MQLQSSTRVITPLGALDGERVRSSHGEVLAFRSIPYAAPPLGPLRFRAPEPPRPWAHTRDARTRGATAPQILGAMRDLPAQSEDCLQLNVWTPSLTGMRPVIAFIHGGAFTAGSSQHTMYDGHELAARGDVVVVSFNYRLGALGYLDLGALGDGDFQSDANCGVRDHIAALRFIRRYIDVFGGDPTDVTIFGQSAGAMSVCTLLATPSAHGLFKRAIAQSGAAHHVTTRADAARMAQLVVEGLGLAPGELPKLRELPVEQVIAAQAACLRDHVSVGSVHKPLYNAGMTLVPVIDGALIPEAPIDAFSAGRASRAPLLLGTNRDEQRFWTVLVDSSKQTLDDAALRKVIERRVPEHAERVVRAYRELSPSAAPWEIYSAIETDRVFRLPALRLAEARAAHAHASYLYAFDFVGPLFEGELGACHTMEVPFSLGLIEGSFGKVFTGAGPDAKRLSSQMLEAWLAFARSGDASSAGLGGWPAFHAQAPQAMRLGVATGLQPARLPIDALWDTLL